MWLFEAATFKVLSLRGDHYELVPSSKILPEVDLEQIAQFAKQADQHAALRAFRDELRGA